MESVKLVNFVEILRQGFSLNNLYILLSIKKEEQPEKLLNFPIGQSIIQGMVRKGLITSGCKILPLGEKLINLASQELIDNSPLIIERIDRETKKDREETFDKWWISFPGTDTFEYRGKKFPGSRALRSKREDCKLLFEKILREGYTVQEMIESVTIEVEQKMEASLQAGENKLKFMQNSLTYLRQRTWEPYIELIRQGHTGKNGNSSSMNATTDI